MAEQKKPTLAQLQKENEALKAEIQALRDANEEAAPVVQIEIPDKRNFMIDKSEYIFAGVAEVWWNGVKVKVADILKNEKLLKEMVQANYSLISKVAK